MEKLSFWIRREDRTFSCYKTTEEKGSSSGYYVFDILFFQGKDLRQLTLMERRKILKELLKKSRSKV